MIGTAPRVSHDTATTDDAPAGAVALRLDGIAVRLGGREILHGIDLRFAAGEIVGIVGPPGAGKTTIIKTITGAITPCHGTVYAFGQLLKPGSPRAAQTSGIAALYQDLALAPNLSPVQNIVLGDEPQTHLFGVVPMIDRQAAAEEAVRALDALGVRLEPSQYHSPVRRLSGGQRQAVAIARALRTSARLLLMDEPTAALGHAGRTLLIDIVRRLAAGGVTVIIVSHDIDMLARVAHRLVVVRRGRIRGDDAPTALDLDRLREEMGEERTDAPDDHGSAPWYRFDLAGWIRGR